MTITITAFEVSPDPGAGLARDMRVRWALEEVGQPYEVRLVPWAEFKHAAHLARHPFGQIPTNEEDGLTLFESGAIVLHVAERFPGLLPKEPHARARAIMWMFAALSTVRQKGTDLFSCLKINLSPFQVENKSVPFWGGRLLVRFILLVLSAALAVGALPARAQGPAPENTGPNTSIVRTVTGKMTFRTISDGRVRGGEEFRLLVHPDGTRQVFVSKDFKAVNGQQTLMARVDARFRPLETYASYWTREGFKGSMYVTVTGNDLNAVAFGPKGRIETALRVPDDISIVHHGEIVNGWYYWSEDPASRAPQTSSVYILNAAPRGDAQVAGFLTQSKFTRLGMEKVTTPAGTFDAMHYRLEGMESLEMWVAGEDRLLVRQTDAKNDREYVLTELNVTPAR